MRLEMTPAARRALEMACHAAGCEGRSEAAPLDLLHGLLVEEEGRAATLLRQAGFSWDAYQPPLADVGPFPDLSGGQPALTEAAREVLSLAVELAREVFTETALASEHLLLALARHDRQVREFLTTRATLLDRLEQQIQAAIPPPLHLDEPLELQDAAEQIDLARILDASANRAREALRVIEDYCRFVLDDPFLSRTCKEMRHTLQESLRLGPPDLALARDTEHDVGTTLSTATEQVRYSLPGVVQASCKRLQEALRSLEEYGKLCSSEMGRQLEALRYRSYTLEKALVVGTSARERLHDARLYVLLTGAQCVRSLEETIALAADGGTQVFQLREKGLDDRALLARARQVRAWTRRAGVLFLVNDRPDIARLVEADGVHLGQEDLPVKEARRLLGPQALVGVSTHSLEQVRQAARDGASYIGVGPTFPSGTKSFSELAGLDFVRAALAETSLPAFVIGGVNLKTIDAAIAAGARRVAVSQAIAAAEDPRATAVALRQKLG